MKVSMCLEAAHLVRNAIVQLSAKGQWKGASNLFYKDPQADTTLWRSRQKTGASFAGNGLEI